MPSLLDLFRRPATPAQSEPTTALAVRPVHDTGAGIIARTISRLRALRGQPVYGRYAGFLEPNREIAPADLFGLSQRDLGILYRMRVAHPVIASGMDFARSAIEAVEYGLEPANGSIRARAARDAVERAFAQTPGLSLPAFVGTVFDLSRTYGFAALETVDAGDGRHIAPRPIAPHLMNAWVLAPDFIGLEGVEVMSGASLVTLDVDRFSWYGRQHFPGQYYGVSDLRPLLSLFAAYEQDLQTYLEQQRLARGILYGQEVEGLTNQESVDRMIEYLARYHRGEDFPLIAPAGVTPEVLSVVNPSVAHFRDMLGYYDTAFREALMSSLGSLGINGEGARSLGESFRVVDAQRLRSRLEQFLRMLNGETSPYSSFLRKMTVNEGYEAEYAPRIVCAGQVGVDMAQQRADLVSLVGAGIVTRDDLGQDNIDRLIAGLGFEVPERAPQPPPATPGDGAQHVDPVSLIQTRARRMPNAIASTVLDGLLRHEATPGVNASDVLIGAARRWVRGQVPTDEDVVMAIQWLSTADGVAALAARPGEPEWLLAKLFGGRSGAEYWRAEYARRGLGNAT